jgi:murein DD-endopeptidase MepM/ murein hydrolase activator NlpD
MANDTYTLIVVPHAKARFRKFQVSVKLTKWLAGVSAVLAVAVVGVLIHYTWISVELSDLTRLRSENTLLASKTKEYEEQAGKLQAKVAVLQGMVNKLGVMAGIDHSLPTENPGGVGGGTTAESMTPPVTSLTDMDRSVAALTVKSAQLEEFYRDQKAMLSSTPSVWPVRGYLSTAFGNRIDPFTGLRDFHPGIDISTPIGTRVQAPADGVVISTAFQGGYGQAIVVDHGYGVVTRYGHLAAYNVKPGQRIRRGEVIGFVGTTGRSTGPHLHYEVWVREQAQNPLQFILDEYRSFR